MDDEQLLRYSRHIMLPEIEPVVLTFRAHEEAQSQLAEAKAMLGDSDADIREMAEEEVSNLTEQIEAQDLTLQTLLLPRDPNDSHNVFLEIRAGTGGDEAAIFAGDLLKMYTRYAENKNWQVELLTERQGEHGGYKEVIARIVGNDVYGQLKFESGAHRVQRVPQTESQGRIHTSACTVAIMPEVEDVDEIEIDKSDLRVDTFRGSAHPFTLWHCG